MYNVIFYDDIVTRTRTSTDEYDESSEIKYATVASGDCSTMTTAVYTFAWKYEFKNLNFDFPSLSVGYGMFKSCYNLEQVCGTYEMIDDNGEEQIYYTSLSFDSLTNATEMFRSCKKLKKVYIYCPSLEEAAAMFDDCVLLEIIDADFSSLKNASSMFSNTLISKVNISSPNIIIANHMFYNCHNYKRFEGELPVLQNGESMFELSGLGSDDEIYNWDISLPQLENGQNMFRATSLYSFASDLPNLKQGDRMFEASGLRKFNGSLSSLETADSMFSGCRLDADSVFYIFDSLPVYSGEEVYTNVPLENLDSGVETYESVPNHTITIGLGCQNIFSLKEHIAKTCGCENWDALTAAFLAKGWIVSWEYNG